ncbi:MAG: DUF4783 domain-containing protein [Ignavibacteriales bacterium]|nr:DUF4783 domain-containing protein [Ignavibacteriales bacterium]MCF8305668.1 DUF4783 domain-containing protein [Ignavibacteriales bacterium]MCF8315390.1 DUF4783 domain-containing protein [Ignavibacteriales bacterium]MCF8436718.1 DUF4783 domain-containing protein [Ignavibacteriales bacterium]
MKKILLTAGLLVLLGSFCFAQENKQILSQETFFRFEKGLKTNRVEEFSNLLAGKVFISHIEGINGYFSRSQAFYILKDFFAIYQPSNPKFEKINTSATFPYASGKMQYNLKSSKETAQFYISLKFEEDTWYISQITIN